MSIELTRNNLLPRDSECPFQVARLLSILSSSGCQSALEKEVDLSGRPRLGDRLKREDNA